MLITGGGSESLLRAHAQGDTDRRSPSLAVAASTGDDIIISAPPTRYSLLARVGGVLRLDGRCLVVDHPAGLRSAIIWPAGARWSPVERVVVHPTGARIRLGDTFYTAGGHLPVPKRSGTPSPDTSALSRLITCGRQAGGDVVLLGPRPVEKE